MSKTFFQPSLNFPPPSLTRPPHCFLLEEVRYRFFITRDNPRAQILNICSAKMAAKTRKRWGRRTKARIKRKKKWKLEWNWKENLNGGKKEVWGRQKRKEFEFVKLRNVKFSFGFLFPFFVLRTEIVKFDLWNPLSLITKAELKLKILLV